MFSWHIAFLPYLIAVTEIAVVHSQSCAKKLIHCVDESGSPGDMRVACSNRSHTLTSCGIRIDYDTFISQGISRSDDVCTIQYHIENGSVNETDIGTRPIPYAHCCDFAACFGDAFQCQLSTKRSQAAATNECSSNYPHLLGCTLEQRFEQTPPDLDVYGGILFSRNDNGADWDLSQDFLALFNISTRSPTVAPISSGTDSFISNTSTLVPTAMPTFAPTILSDSVGVRDFGATYVREQATFGGNRCSMQRFAGNSEFLWLYSLCCADTDIVTVAPTATTAAPTLTPTVLPTDATASPTVDVFVDAEDIFFLTDSYPLNQTLNESVRFDDYGLGRVQSLFWGVSNASRQYTVDSVTGGITAIRDIELSEHYFTIKSYTVGFEGAESTFTSEYGTIFLPDIDNYTICKAIPTGSSSAAQIELVHVFVNATTRKIEGLSMWRKEDTTSDYEIYTCHTAMARNQSLAFREALLADDLVANPQNTINYTDCTSSGAGLSGFFGTAHGFDIDVIGFQFVGTSSDDVSGCPNTITPEPTPGPAPTFSPTPSPTPSPLSSAESANVPQSAVYDGSLQCYYVMDKQMANCSDSYHSNPSFIVDCAAYSLFDAPNEHYIENNSCIVGALQVRQIAAIATCCVLIDTVTIETNVCIRYFGLSGSVSDAGCAGIIVGISVGILAVIACFGVGIAYVVVRSRKQEEEERRANKPLTIIRTTDGEQRLILDDEQNEDRLGLKKVTARFTVTDEDIAKMLTTQQNNDVGLQE